MYLSATKSTLFKSLTIIAYIFKTYNAMLMMKCFILLIYFPGCPESYQTFPIIVAVATEVGVDLL